MPYREDRVGLPWERWGMKGQYLVETSSGYGAGLPGGIPQQTVLHALVRLGKDEGGRRHDQRGRGTHAQATPGPGNGLNRGNKKGGI